MNICWPFNKCTRPIFAYQGIELGVKLKSLHSLQRSVMHKANLDLCVSSNSQSIQIHPFSNRSTLSQCIGKTPLLMPFILAKVGKSELIAVIPQIRAALSVHLVSFTLASKMSGVRCSIPHPTRRFPSNPTTYGTMVLHPSEMVFFFLSDQNRV